jgi:O-succinylbenzoate synthase
MVQESIATPICLDESLTSVSQADVALELQSCRYLNVQPGRAGGLTAAVAIHDAARQNNVPCFVGAMPQSAIGTRINLALAAKENFTYPADYFPTAEILAEDVAEPLVPERTGDGPMQIALWSGPGVGIEPNTKSLERLSIAQSNIA